MNSFFKHTFFKQLRKEAQKIRLSPRERERVWLALYSEMRPSSITKSPIHIAPWPGRPSPLLFFTPRLVSSLAFVLVLAVVGSSTAYAAEAAVPGDILYPLKIKINEPVRAALAASPESKAAVYARFAERRMEEAQVLAARGTLTTEVKDELEARFEKLATDMEDIVGTVEQEDPVAAADISARFGSSVEAHSAIIARLSEEAEGEESKRESVNLSRSFMDRGRRLARAEATLALKAEGTRSLKAAPTSGAEATLSAVFSSEDVDSAVIARIDRTASTTLEEAESFLDALKDSLDATTSERTKEQISKIRKRIEKLRGEGNGASGKEKIERALDDSMKIKFFLEAQGKFPDHMLLPAPEREEDNDGKDDSSSKTDASEDREGEQN